VQGAFLRSSNEWGVLAEAHLQHFQLEKKNGAKHNVQAVLSAQG